MNVFSSCSEMYNSEEYTSALSKLIRFVVRRNKAFTLRMAVFMLAMPSLLRASFSRKSSRGALINVNGVRISCAVLMKKCIFSSETFRCFFRIRTRRMITAMREIRIAYNIIAQGVSQKGWAMIISMLLSSSITRWSSLEMARTRNTYFPGARLV